MTPTRLPEAADAQTIRLPRPCGTSRGNEKLQRAGPGPALALPPSRGQYRPEPLPPRRIGTRTESWGEPERLSFQLPLFIRQKEAQERGSRELEYQARHDGSEPVAAHVSVARLQLGEHPSGAADTL